MSNGKELAVKTQTPTPSAYAMTPRTFEEALKYAELMSDSDLVPSGYKGKPGNILVAIQKGMEVGLSPMAALETIAVINGRASLWGDGMLALVQAHPSYEGIDEGQSTDKEGICRVKRKGEPPYTVRFSLEDAKRAGLLGKPGPWTQYTKRMLQLRARGFALRDKFADALKGMIAAEEALDVVSVQVETTEAVSPLSLKDKLKAQMSGLPPLEHPALPEPAAPVESDTPDRAIDFATIKADFDTRLSEAKTFKEAAAVRDEVRDSDLPTSYKEGFLIAFRKRFEK